MAIKTLFVDPSRCIGCRACEAACRECDSHKGESMIRTIAMQMLEPITPPSKVNPDLRIPPALESIVMKALEKKREERYATMNELLAALDDIAPKLDQLQSLPPLPPGATSAITPAPGVPLLSGPDASTVPGRRAKPFSA